MFVLTHTHIYIYTFDYSSIGNQSIESTNRAYYLRKSQRHTFSLISNTHLRAFAHTHTHTLRPNIWRGLLHSYDHPTWTNECRRQSKDGCDTIALQFYCTVIFLRTSAFRPLLDFLLKERWKIENRSTISALFLWRFLRFLFVIFVRLLQLPFSALLHLYILVLCMYLLFSLIFYPRMYVCLHERTDDVLMLRELLFSFEIFFWLFVVFRFSVSRLTDRRPNDHRLSPLDSERANEKFGMQPHNVKHNQWTDQRQPDPKQQQHTISPLFTQSFRTFVLCLLLLPTPILAHSELPVFFFRCLPP